MSSVAEQLRRAREEQGLSLRELAEVTKLRVDHLEALEQANYQPFPAPVYIRGSVRTCATVLRLDVEAVLAALDAELAQSPEFGEPPSLTGEHRGPVDWVMYRLSRVNWRVAGPLVLGVVVLALVIWTWNAVQERRRADPLEHIGPGLYEPPPLSEDDLLPLEPR